MPEPEWRERARFQHERSANLLECASALAALAAKMEPQAAAEIAEGLAAALVNPHFTYLLARSLGSALAALAAKMEPQAAAKIAKDLVTVLANPQETDFYRLSSLSETLAAFCVLLPSAHNTHLLALSNLWLTTVTKKEDEGKEQPYNRKYNRKLFTAVCAQLRSQDLTEVLKYPFSTVEAEQIVLLQLEANTGRNFAGNVWKFVEQANTLGIKDVGSPAHRPSAQEALKELDAL